MDNFLEIEIGGKYVIVGDIHGCLEEFKELLRIVEDKYGKGCRIISVGDTIDRGEYNIDTLLFTLSLYREGRYLEVKSNHLDKFVRWLKGSKVSISYGMQKTVDEFLSLNKKVQDKIRDDVIEYYEKLPLYIIINQSVVVAHAGIKDEFIYRSDKQVRSFVLYGETTGRYTEKGFPERIDWTKSRRVNKNSPKIVYGHVVQDEVYVNNLCYGIDTGAVLGNKLTAYCPQTEEFIQVNSKRAYYTFE